MRIPKKKRAKPPVAPAGRYTGTLTGASAPSLEGQHLQAFWMFEWSCARDAASYDLVQICDTEKEAAEVLLDLGFAGQNAELTDAIGRKAMVKVSTFAGGKYARVTDTEPMPG